MDSAEEEKAKEKIKKKKIRDLMRKFLAPEEQKIFDSLSGDNKPDEKADKK